MADGITLRELQGIPVERLKGVGDKKQASLRDVGVTTVLDLLTTYPRRWVDRTNEARVSDLVPGQEPLMHVVFFNQPWRERQLREGVQIALFGKADVFRGGLQMTNPIVDMIGDRTGK